MIFGRGGLFDNQDWGVGTVDSLNEMGIPTYVQETSVTGATFDSVYQDIENLGKLFNVPEAAAAFEKELKDRQSALEEKVADKEEQTLPISLCLIQVWSVSMPLKTSLFSTATLT